MAPVWFDWRAPKSVDSFCDSSGASVGNNAKKCKVKCLQMKKNNHRKSF